MNPEPCSSRYLYFPCDWTPEQIKEPMPQRLKTEHNRKAVKAKDRAQ